MLLMEAPMISDEFTLRINSIPTLDNRIPNQSVQVDLNLFFTFSDATFSDLNSDDILSYNASLANNNPLPAWLNFNSDTRTFSGTPGVDDEGIYNIHISAIDQYNGRVDTNFLLFVKGENEPPIVLNPIQDIVIAVNEQLQYKIENDTFFDPSGNYNMTYYASLSNGAPLSESWLSFDPDTNIFSGTPELKDYGNHYILLVADNTEGQVNEYFTIRVNTVPYVDTPLISQVVNIGSSLNYKFDSDCFNDLDGDILYYTAKQSNGFPLPSWLGFSSGSRQFIGVPSLNDRGLYNITVIAEDTYGGYVNDTFSIRANVIPELYVSISDQVAFVNESFIFTLPNNTFIDIDNDILEYTITQTSNSPLPNWLSFHPNNLTLSGMPQFQDSGLIR